MKNLFIGVVLSITLLGSIYKIEAVDGGIQWRRYLPSRESLQCYLNWGVRDAVRSYQYAILAQLALAGDTVALQAWLDLLKTYNPSELLCMVGGENIRKLADTLAQVLPITGLSWATQQVLLTAIYQALEKLRLSGQ